MENCMKSKSLLLPHKEMEENLFIYSFILERCVHFFFFSRQTRQLGIHIFRSTFEKNSSRADWMKVNKLLLWWGIYIYCQAFGKMQNENEIAVTLLGGKGNQSRVRSAVGKSCVWSFKIQFKTVSYYSIVNCSRHDRVSSGFTSSVIYKFSSRFEN